MSFAFAVTSDSIKVIPLDVSLDDMVSDIDSLMSPFHNVRPENVQSTPFRAAIAYRLYNELFAPIEQAIELPTEILIIPDENIINLNFEMLLTSKPIFTEYLPTEIPTYAEHFLVHRHSFVNNPTLNNFGKHAKSNPKSKKILVCANPLGHSTGMSSSLRSIPAWQFDPLPYAQLEADKIAKIYPNTEILSREKAQEQAIVDKTENCLILHLATHAFVDSTFDAFSGLVFALGNDSTDDGVLMGYEISELDLSCDLVTLSACETGRGRLVKGEGVMGLPRQFLAAGAKSVLMTLWKVDDRFTSQLMPEFYELLLKEKLPKSSALLQAKLRMLDTTDESQGIYYQHPFYWASFVMYGDPGPQKLPFLNLTIMVISLSIFMAMTLCVHFLLNAHAG